MQDQPVSPVPINTQTEISRNQSLLVAQVGDEIVMMDVESGHYYGLDDIGSDIWRRLESPSSFADLIVGLSADYDAEPAIIAEDVRLLITKMAAQGVVTLA